MMKKIGFIDYFIDEWHANHFPQWINDVAKARGIDICVSYVYADIDAPDGLATKEWCDKFGVEQLSSIEELVEKSDYIMVLAPNNPQHHERLSQLPLMSGKPLFIDKTFAPDFNSAVRMVKLAIQYDTPLLSTSALRYADELLAYPNDQANRETVRYTSIVGDGQFNKYIIHLIEMLVTIMGTGAKRVKSLSNGDTRLFVIEYADGRGGSMLQMPCLAFRASVQLENEEFYNVSNVDDIFPNFVSQMFDFFDSRISPVPIEETLEAMAIREACSNALGSYDEWFDIKKK